MNKLLLVLMLIPVISWAGVKSDSKGGGGGSVVACYTPEGELKSVELLDVYEAKTKGWTLQKFTGDFEQDITSLGKKLYKQDDFYVRAFITNVSAIHRHYRPIPRDAELELVNDAWPVFFPKGCKLKQVVNFYNLEFIWLDENLYEKMDYLNQLALAVHEAIYYEERTYGVPDSRYARMITGRLLSQTDPFVPVILDGAGFYCTTLDLKTRFKATQVNAPDKKNTFLLEFEYLNGHKIYSKKTTELELGNSPISQDDPEQERDLFYTASGLNSSINAMELLQIETTRANMKIAWRGTDPGDSHDWKEVRCNYYYRPGRN